MGKTGAGIVIVLATNDRSTMYAVLAVIALVGLGLIVWSASDNRALTSDEPQVEAPATNPNQ